MFGKKNNEEYDPDADPPEAKLNRQKAEEEKRRSEADMEIIDGLLASLTAADAHRHIFTWAEQKKWLLRRKRKPR